MNGRIKKPCKKSYAQEQHVHESKDWEYQKRPKQEGPQLFYNTHALI